MNTAPDFPDLPTLFAHMRRQDGLDKQRPPRQRFAEIRELARRQSPAERQAAIDFVNRVQVGLDALALGSAFVEQGDLDAAVRMFTIAVRHGADGAEEELQAVQRLQAAFAEPGVPDETVLGPPELEQHPRDDAGVRGISAYTLDWADQRAQQITTEARANAAQIVQQAEETAAALIADAEATAERIRADAQVAGNEVRAGSADVVYHGVFVDDDRIEAQHYEIDPAPPRADLSINTLGLAKRHLGTGPGGEVQRLLLPGDQTFLRVKLAHAAVVKNWMERLIAPTAERRPARAEPRQAPVTYGRRLILPHLPMDMLHGAAGPEDFERWSCARVDDEPGPRLLVVAFNLRFLAGPHHAVDHGDEDWCSAELAHACQESFLPVILNDTCLPRRSVTWLYSDLSCMAPEAVLTPEDSDDREPRVITDLSTY